VQADRVELDIAERSGQLVDAREVVKELSAANTATRALLLQIPERLAAAMTESQRDMIREEIEHALRNLAAYDPSQPSDPFGLGEVSSAGAHDGGAVGRIPPLPERPFGHPGPL
jgi:phage terminase Nu1 subunit (DNA packaging protein)